MNNKKILIQLQASCYLTKPVQLDAFERLLKSINEFGYLVQEKDSSFDNELMFGRLNCRQIAPYV
jgi:hypothetical protein